jgi:hypothetical protein
MQMKLQLSLNRSLFFYLQKTRSQGTVSFAIQQKQDSSIAANQLFASEPLPELQITSRAAVVPNKSSKSWR